MPFLCRAIWAWLGCMEFGIIFWAWLKAGCGGMPGCCCSSIWATIWFRASWGRSSFFCENSIKSFMKKMVSATWPRSVQVVVKLELCSNHIYLKILHNGRCDGIFVDWSSREVV